MSAAENLQREDLSAIETIEAIVGIFDAELIKDKVQGISVFRFWAVEAVNNRT